jgi:hypothetical protein
LPRGPPQAQNGRKQDEEIEIEPEGRTMQVPGAGEFRPQNTLEEIPAGIGEQRVLEHGGGVDHSLNGRHGCTDLRHDGIDFGCVGDIRCDELHFRVPPQPLDRGAAGRSRLVAPGQYQMLGAGLDQRSSGLQSEPAEAADDPISRLGSEIGCGFTAACQPDEPGDQSLPCAITNLVFAIFRLQFAQQQIRGDIRRGLGRQIDQPAPHFRIFESEAAPQTP